MGRNVVALSWYRAEDDLEIITFCTVSYTIQTPHCLRSWRTGEGRGFIPEKIDRFAADSITRFPRLGNRPAGVSEEAWNFAVRGCRDYTPPRQLRHLICLLPRTVSGWPWQLQPKCRRGRQQSSRCLLARSTGNQVSENEVSGREFFGGENYFSEACFAKISFSNGRFSEIQFFRYVIYFRRGICRNQVKYFFSNDSSAEC